MADLSSEGSIATWLQHDNANWPTDENGYKFPEIVAKEVTFNAAKKLDKTITITIDGPFGDQFVFAEAMPACGPKGLHVAVTWKCGAVNLYLNGALVKTVTASTKDKDA